jgi:hypothetical protein
VKLGDLVEIITLANEPTGVFGLVTGTSQMLGRDSYEPVVYVWVHTSEGVDLYHSCTVRIVSSAKTPDNLLTNKG